MHADKARANDQVRRESADQEPGADLAPVELPAFPEADRRPEKAEAVDVKHAIPEIVAEPRHRVENKPAECADERQPEIGHPLAVHQGDGVGADAEAEQQDGIGDDDAQHI